MRKEEVNEAERHLESLLAANPLSLYAPQALMLLSECYKRKGATQRAVRALEKLKFEYPESPLAPKVDARIKRLMEDPASE